MKINAENILENCVSDLGEDAPDRIVDADGFIKFVEEWNKKQDYNSYYPDYSRVIVLDRKRYDAMVKLFEEIHKSE